MVAIPEKDYDGHGLILNNKGLFERVWDKGKKREYRVRKITKAGDLFRLLDRDLFIEEGTRLEAIYKLLATDNAHHVCTFGFPNSWVAEYVDEYLRIKKEKLIKKWDSNYSHDGIEYLELHWQAYQDGDFYKRYGDKKILSGFNRPDFHGIGFVQQSNNKDEYGNLMCKKGQRINWAIEFTPLEELLDIPLKLNLELNLYDEDTFKPVGKKHEWIMPMTLYQVIYGIFWELSFCGGPVSKSKEKDRLDAVIKEVDEAIASGNTSKFVPVDLDQLNRIGEHIGDKN